MANIHQKHLIIESVNGLDSVQTEQVLQFIQGLMAPSKEEPAYLKLKRKALKQIRQALGKKRNVSPSF